MGRGMLKEKKPLMPKNRKKYLHSEGTEVEEYDSDLNQRLSE